MQLRKRSVFAGLVAGMAMVSAPAFAKVVVEESLATPNGASSDSAASGGDAGVNGWDEKEGGFHTGKGDFRLVVGGRLNPSFDGIWWDDDVADENTVTFSLRRARVYMLGNFMGTSNTFFLQMGADTDDALLGVGGTESDFSLLDGWIKHSFSSSFYLKGGQFKTPFSRSQLTSSGKMQFANRSIATDTQEFDLRDVGVEIGGGFNEDKIQWSAALVNGDGPNELNGDDRFGMYGRFSFNPTGSYGYSEGDLENSDTLATTLGIAGHFQKRPSGSEYTRVVLDGGLKYRGWGFQTEFYFTDMKVDEDADGVNENSMYVQGGYFIDPKKIEIVARWSHIGADGDDNDDSEYTAGINWFFMGHRLKWQTAFSVIDSQYGDTSTNRLTTQAQLWF